jgi:isoquinoline 1-oxidoreductase beta subunit
MSTSAKIPRRKFIGLSAASGAMLALGFLPTDARESRIVNLLLEPDNDAVRLNAYIFIEPSGKITLFNHRPEMGQGTYQSIPMIIAEELEVEVDKITIASSPANRAEYGDQMVVGSRSIQTNYDLLRRVGAAAKDMLIRAAANGWGVSPDECVAEKASVIHKASGRKQGYGELVEQASKLTPPENPVLKDPGTFHTIGKSIPRRDIPMKVNGEAKFGMDFTLPGMLYASLVHSATFRGKVVNVNEEKARAIIGVKDVIRTQRDTRGAVIEAVAVLADTYWAAEQGAKALEVTWDSAGLENVSSETIWEEYRKAASQEAVVFKREGEFEGAYAMGKVKVEASYETPYQAHACMEPMNVTVHVQQNKCEFWGSTQNPNGVKSFLANFCGLDEDQVIINYTFMGGGFGRRGMTDVVEEAADLSKKTGAPVKVIWTREDDISQGPFRACSLNVCRGALDERGQLVALEHKVVCQEINNQVGDNMKAGQQIAGGINTAYAIPNYVISGVLRKNHIPITYWRSVYHSTNCFAHESFIDELAHGAKKDPMTFRLWLLRNHPRYTEVLNTVAELSGWYQPREKNTAKGVAIVERSGAYVAMVVNVARVKGKVSITAIYAAIDVGTTIHPDTVKAQTEGSVVMGLTAAIKSSITIARGAVAERNFDRYKMLEMKECPPIYVEVVPSMEKPEGAGEGGLPPVAPALTNAIFELTRKRIRKLPFNLDEV